MAAKGASTLEGSGPPPADVREHAMHGLALASAAGGLAHEVKNPLHAMGLQLALLGEVIGEHPDLARSCAGPLAKLREQIERVDQAVRRLALAADPEGGGGLDAGLLVAWSASLLERGVPGRRATVRVSPASPGMRARGDRGRAGRLWLGLLWRAVVEAGEGGAVGLSAAAEGGEVLLRLEVRRTAPAPELEWIAEAAARGAEELGGRLEQSEAEGLARVTLRLPAEGR